MTSIETNFRSLSRLTAECQRQIERLHHVDSITVHKEVSELIKNSLRSLEEDIQVSYEKRWGAVELITNNKRQ